MQWHVHKGKGGPVLVQFSLANSTHLELWVNPASIAEAGFIVSEIFSEDEYFKHGVTLKQGDTVIDVGANIGVFGARVLALVPSGDVRYVGIEPCPQNFQLLQQNLIGSDGQGQQKTVFHINPGMGGPLEAAAEGRKCARYPGNIQLIQTAVSSSCGTCSMTYYARMPGNSTMRPDEKCRLQQAITPPAYMQAAETLTVPKTTLSKLLADCIPTGDIHLLKVDVEGEELEVLRGLDAADWARIQQVALEVHDCIDTAAQTDAGATAQQDELHGHQAQEQPLQQPQQQQQLCEQQQQQQPQQLQQQQQQQQQQQHLCQQQPHQQQEEGGAYAQFPMLQQMMNSLPGSRSSKDIDGTLIRYHPLPFRILSGLKDHSNPAAAAALAQLCVPPPRDEGRVMAIAKMLRDQGFRVVIECPFGLPMNYSVYARREQ